MKLLQYTVKSYLLYSLLVILLAIPAFYLIIRALFMQDVDEALLQHKQMLIQELTRQPQILQGLPWHDLSGDIELAAGPASSPEGIRTVNRYNEKTGEEEPFRELHTSLTIQGIPYTAIIRISLIDSEDLAQGIILTQFLLLALLLGGLILVNRRQSKKLWRPFYEILEQLRTFELDTSAPLRFSPARVLEFRDLQKAITQLTEQNYRVYLQQKEFTENAAHEMQTPLAILQAKLELLIQPALLDHKQAQAIQSLIDAVGRLTKLNRELLLLTKIENRQFSEIHEICLGELIRRLLAQWDMQIEMKRLMVEEFAGNVSLRANLSLTETLFSNLLSNALQYTPADGRICIAVTPQYTVISNSGPSLPFPEEKLFDRFQKGSHTGTGLGLAIAKQICDINGWHIEYAYKGGLHQFTVQFRHPIVFSRRNPA